MIRRSAVSLALAGALIIATVPSAAARSVVQPQSAATQSIVEIAIADGRFDTLVTAVLCADPAVLAALTSGEKYTVYAPTDDAFEAVGLTSANVCSAFDQATLTNVLLYHVQDGRHFSNSVLPRNGGMKEIHTLLGVSFWVDASGDITPAGTDTDPDIIIPNINATNGVIHAVDAVLLPVFLG